MVFHPMEIANAFKSYYASLYNLKDDSVTSEPFFDNISELHYIKGCGLRMNPRMQKSFSLASFQKVVGKKEYCEHLIRDFAYASKNIECQKKSVKKYIY